MACSAKILADSISPAGVRLTSLEVVFARCVLAEFNTHRMLSRNSASSRAIPFEKMIARVMADPYIPAWTKNQKGMVGELLDPNSDAYLNATTQWLLLRDEAVSAVERIGRYGVHKQDVNRALEPWMWHTVIVTATEWDNFDHLRDHPGAHPAIQTAARAMIEARKASTPRELKYGEWHLPLISDEELFFAGRVLAHANADQARIDEEIYRLIKISVGRCARVSYLTHDGKRDQQADIELHDRLLSNGHMSPFEHVARPMIDEDVKNLDVHIARVTGFMESDAYTGPIRRYNRWSGNFRGWVQYRKTIPNEHDILGAR